LGCRLGARYDPAKPHRESLWLRLSFHQVMWRHVGSYFPASGHRYGHHKQFWLRRPRIDLIQAKENA